MKTRTTHVTNCQKYWYPMTTMNHSSGKLIISDEDRIRGKSESFQTDKESGMVKPVNGIKAISSCRETSTNGVLLNQLLIFRPSPLVLKQTEKEAWLNQLMVFQFSPLVLSWEEKEAWLNQLKGFPTLPSSFEASTKRGMVKPVNGFPTLPYEVQVINTITSLQQTFRQLQFCFLYSILYVRLYQSSRQQQIVNRQDNSSQFPWHCFVQMVLRVEFYVCMFLVVPSSNQMSHSVRNCSESDILITLFFIS